MNFRLVLFLSIIAVLVSFQNCSPFVSSLEGGSSFFSGYQARLANNPYTCLPNTDPEVQPLRRLTKQEYLNTLYDLFQGEVSVEQIRSFAEEIPGEEISTSFKNFSNIPSLSHINGYLKTAEQMTAVILADNLKLKRATGVACIGSDNSLSAPCFETFANTFLKRVLRRPILSSEKAKMLFLYNSMETPEAGLSAMITYSLVSPSFLYLLELEGKDLDGRQDLLLINDYELASRLSYFLTASMPDRELLALAEQGSLNNPEEISKQSKRLLASARAKEMMGDFLAQWLQIDPSASAYTPAFRGDIVTNSALQQNASRELNDFVVQTVWTDGGTFKDLLLSRKAYFTDSELGKIYGVQGNGTKAVLLPEGERLGILTRAQYLMTGSDDSRPMHRGAGFQRNILCYGLNQPPPFPDDPTALMPPAFDPNLTTRERFHEKTNKSACIGCHVKINPPAFAFEHFDSLGRFRNVERILNKDGQLVNTLPIEGSDQLTIESGEQLQFQNPLELIQKISGTPVPSACFVEKWVSYANGRLPGINDSCTLSKMYDSANIPGEGVMHMILKLTTAETFRARKINRSEEI